MVVFYQNPPYAEASGISGIPAGNKNSHVAEDMQENGLGICANELTAQFVYRIEKEFGGKCYLVLFSKAKLITRKALQGLRKRWIPKFEGGFMLKARQASI